VHRFAPDVKAHLAGRCLAGEPVHSGVAA
jgi:hypothetical protein